VKRYQFRLEVVLRLRRAEEEQAKESLMAANRHLRRSVERRDVALGRYRALAAPLGPLGREEFDRERSRATLAADALQAAQRHVTSAAAAAALAQIEWSQAARKVAVLERLDARRRAEHADEERREEVAVVDDIVTLRFVTERSDADAWPVEVPA